jgi:hypothetical protein
MRSTLKAGKNHFIVIMAEGVTGKRFGGDEALSAACWPNTSREKTGIESRATVIFHCAAGRQPHRPG